MNKYIHQFNTVIIKPGTNQSTKDFIPSSLPKRATRRMSDLGLLLYAVTEGLCISSETSVVYTTTYTEAQALENFLDSLPYASPTAFQKSIHPGGLEQAMIIRQQPIGPFYPIAGQKDILPLGLRTACLSTTKNCLMCGGEETGTWLKDFDAAYDKTFAFALLLNDSAENALGEIIWEPKIPTLAADSQPSHSLEAFAKNLDARENFQINGGIHGTFQIKFTENHE